MKPFRCNPSGNEVFLTLAVEAETELMSFDWASGCGSRDVTVWFQTRSAERESLQPHSRTRLQAWRQHSGVTLPIITLRCLPLSLWSFSERNKRRGKFQKDKIPNWKWQISPPSFIQNRPAVSVLLWAHFHTHSQSLYTDQVSLFPLNLYVASAAYIFPDSTCIFIEIPAIAPFPAYDFGTPQTKLPHRRLL